MAAEAAIQITFEQTYIDTPRNIHPSPLLIIVINTANTGRSRQMLQSWQKYPQSKLVTVPSSATPSNSPAAKVLLPIPVDEPFTMLVISPLAGRRLRTAALAGSTGTRNSFNPSRRVRILDSSLGLNYLNVSLSCLHIL